jgi:histidinol-phosphate/aromatic aminotransferase/cobyric acid decarboxylase-like protein
LIRRDWLIRSSIALGGLALPTVSRGAQTFAHPARARLSLNEILFGPSLSARGAIQSRLGDVCRYSDEVERRLTQAIAAYENVSAGHIVLGAILGLGLHLSRGWSPRR